MQTIVEKATVMHARMMVLKTQSCNTNAITFFRKNKFSVIGLDLYVYSNTDPQRHEVRVEIERMLTTQKASDEGLFYKKTAAMRDFPTRNSFLFQSIFVDNSSGVRITR